MHRKTWAAALSYSRSSAGRRIFFILQKILKSELVVGLFVIRFRTQRVAADRLRDSKQIAENFDLLAGLPGQRQHLFLGLFVFLQFLAVILVDALHEVHPVQHTTQATAL